MRALKITVKDLEILADNKRMSMYPDLTEIADQGFLTITIEGIKFVLSAKTVCGPHYGGKWMDAIMVVCVNNNTFNDSIGSGTTLINVVSEEVHSKIIQHLTEA